MMSVDENSEMLTLFDAIHFGLFLFYAHLFMDLSEIQTKMAKSKQKTVFVWIVDIQYSKPAKSKQYKHFFCLDFAIFVWISRIFKIIWKIEL
jgi:hypothetical protein